MAKAVKKQALGRGLSALLKDPSNDIKSMNDPNADNPLPNACFFKACAISINYFS